MLLPIAQITVDNLDDVAPKDALVAKLRARLKTVGPIGWRPHAEDAWVLALSLEHAPLQRSVHKPTVFKLALYRRDGSGKSPYFEAREPLMATTLSERQLAPLLVRALGVVRLQHKLSELSVRELVPWLSQTELPQLLRRNRVAGSGHGLQMFVLDELSRRRAKEAVPALRALLKDARAPDALDRQRALALRAVGALVAMGEQSAVPDLIDLAQRQGAETVAHLAHAISALGGRIAEGYLVTLASGHEHEAVRAEAADALGALLGEAPQNF